MLTFAGTLLTSVAVELMAVGMVLTSAGTWLTVAGTALMVAGTSLTVAGMVLTSGGTSLTVPGQVLTAAGSLLTSPGSALTSAGKPLTAAGSTLKMAEMELDPVICTLNCAAPLMNRAQYNRKEMFNTTLSYMTNHNGVWAEVPAIVQAMNEFSANITLIGDKIMKQEMPIAGEAMQKQNARDALEGEMLNIASQIFALGAATHNMELAMQVDLSLSQLDNMTDDGLEERCVLIEGLMGANLAALADYGLVADDLTALGALRTAFHNFKSAPRTAAAERKSQTTTLPQLLRDTTSLLRLRLDKLVLRYRTSDPVFYAGYLAARVIVDKGNPPAPAKNPAP